MTRLRAFGTVSPVLAVMARVGSRVDAETESEGLDITGHGSAQADRR